MKMMYLVLKFLIYIKMTLRGKWPFLQTYSNLSLPVVRAIFWATMSPAVLQCVPMQPNTKEKELLAQDFSTSALPMFSAGKSLLWEAALCNARCLTESLYSNQQMPVAPPVYNNWKHPQTLPNGSGRAKASL